MRPFGVQTRFIEPGSPWEHGYNQTFNGKAIDKLLHGEMLTTLREAQVVIESWRVHDTCFRPHSSLGYQPPAPRALLEAVLATAAAYHDKWYKEAGQVRAGLPQGMGT